MSGSFFSSIVFLHFHLNKKIVFAEKLKAKAAESCEELKLAAVIKKHYYCQLNLNNHLGLAGHRCGCMAAE